MLRQRYCIGIRREDSDKRQEHLGMENQLTYSYINCAGGCEGERWMQLAQGREQRRTLIITAVNYY